MTELELLFLVLALVYFWECACWLPANSLALITWREGHWRIARPGTLLGNQRGGFVFAPPLPPLGLILTTHPLPLAISAEAVVANVQGGAAWRNQEGKPLPLDELREIKVRGKKLFLNSRPFLKAASPIYAEKIAVLLHRLQKLSRPERDRALEEVVRESFDLKKIKRLWAEFKGQTTSLRVLENLLFAYLFIIAPVLIWIFGLSRLWPGLLLALFMQTTGIAIQFRRAHKHLFPNAEDERFNQFLMVQLSPATTIRAHDLLSRPLLEEFHPLALAKVFCSREEFRALALNTLLETRHRTVNAGSRPDSLATKTQNDSSLLWEKETERFLKHAGIDPDKSVAPPLPADETCRSYCPRCMAQFTLAEGACPDCGGLRLVPFPNRTKKA